MIPRWLVEHVSGLVERRCVHFSKPSPSCETRRDPARRFCRGGLRHHGEWISTCALIGRTLRAQGMRCDVFYSTDTGRRFVRALESRLCSLSAQQLFQVLLAGLKFEAPIEGIVCRELLPQLSGLDTVSVLRLPSLVASRDPAFWRVLWQELDSRQLGDKSCSGVLLRVETHLLDSLRSDAAAYTSK
ncbi:arginine deiminase, putative [Babesia ovata]|nr:arginine deiminase, putative [Babesia ovata]GBE61268.1 arginine deiminase, putative [Babesia ovata]